MSTKIRDARLRCKGKGIKQIQSPIARYTETGSLMCVVCDIMIRNEATWPVHLVSKNHKENIEKLKEGKIKSSPTIQQSISIVKTKRTASPVKEEFIKISRIEDNSKNNSSTLKPKELPAHFFDKPKTPKVDIVSTRLIKNEDSNTESNEEENKSSFKTMEETKKERDCNLPEGFFDDPILDAKIRNVEYKNPMEEEWEQFQREIKEETAQSAQIIAEDQEEATSVRHYEEYDEQMHNWSRVMRLVQRKEAVKPNEIKRENSLDDNSSDDEIDYDEEMDWRSKESKI